MENKISLAQAIKIVTFIPSEHSLHVLSIEQNRFLSLQIMPFEYGVWPGLLFGQSQILSDGGQSILHSSSGCPPITLIKSKGIAEKTKICKNSLD